MPKSFSSSRGVERITDQHRRTHAQQAGKGQVAGFEGAPKIGLADAQHDESYELQQQDRTVENQVDGDEALEGELERQRPCESEQND